MGNLIKVSAQSRTQYEIERQRQAGYITVGDEGAGVTGTQSGLNFRLSDLVTRNNDQRNTKLAQALGNNYLPPARKKAVSNIEAAIEEIEAMFGQFGIELGKVAISYEDGDITFGFAVGQSMFADNAQTALQSVRESMIDMLEKPVSVACEKFCLWIKVINFGSAR